MIAKTSPSSIAAAALLLAPLARAWRAGNQQTESHPRLTWKRCSGTGGNNCQSVNGEVVLDANWRWIHNNGGYENCYDGNTWSSQYCSSNSQCLSNCVIEGVDSNQYQNTYGIRTSGDELSIRFVTEHQYGTNVGGRVYLMENADRYQMFNLLNQEFTFDVDVSQLDCGLNGALYFVNMPANGDGDAGARYGLGYCDSQCPRDLKFIDGQPNAEGWQPSDSDANAGVGQRGACCAEMDIWEANKISQALTPHSCDNEGYHSCSGENCGGTYSGQRYAGDCDPNGCDFNPYRLGVKDFYGPGMTVDTNRPLTVVTQFHDNNGQLSISRVWVQDGEIIEQPEPAIAGISGTVLDQAWCDAEEVVFSEEEYPFNDHGGMASMRRALQQGVVLVMSIWGDHYAHMEWLDSNYPPDCNPSTPGCARGSCPNGISDPNDLVNQIPDATTTFSNIRVGPIGSTYNANAPVRKRNVTVA